jgi:predicted nucleic acid-binding protein
MIVVADASPLNYLILIERTHLLPKLYRRIFVPETVFNELQHPGAPAPVRSWVAHPPDWLEVCAVRTTRDEALLGLDPGERDVILLALDRAAALVLIDDAQGRYEATRRGIRIAGTLAVLGEADRHRLVDLRAELERLLQTNFRVSSKLISQLLSRWE